MTRTPTPRKPRASSQARIVTILAAARELLAAHGVAGLSIYSVAEHAQIPPSSVYHFFASVPALLEALTADVHRAAEFGPGSQARIGPDQGARPDRGAFDMRERVDHRPGPAVPVGAAGELRLRCGHAAAESMVGAARGQRAEHLA